MLITFPTNKSNRRVRKVDSRVDEAPGSSVCLFNPEKCRSQWLFFKQLHVHSAVCWRIKSISSAYFTFIPG